MKKLTVLFVVLIIGFLSFIDTSNLLKIELDRLTHEDVVIKIFKARFSSDRHVECIMYKGDRSIHPPVIIDKLNENENEKSYKLLNLDRCNVLAIVAEKESSQIKAIYNPETKFFYPLDGPGIEKQAKEILRDVSEKYDNKYEWKPYTDYYSLNNS